MFVEMEEKNQLVIRYVNQIKNNFEKSGNPVSEETVRNVINRYIDCFTFSIEKRHNVFLNFFWWQDYRTQ